MHRQEFARVAYVPSFLCKHFKIFSDSEQPFEGLGRRGRGTGPGDLKDRVRNPLRTTLSLLTWERSQAMISTRFRASDPVAGNETISGSPGSCDVETSFVDRGRSMWRKIAWPTAGILLAA